MKTENHAKKVLRVLDLIHNTKNDKSAKEAWRVALQSPPGDEATLLKKLGEFMTSPEKVASAMNSQYPRLKSQTDTWLHKITKAFISQDLTSTINTFQRNYAEADSKFLIVMSEMINITSYEELNQEQIRNSKEKLEGLINDVLESDLEDKLKNYIVKSIRRVIVALEDYVLYGTVPIIESIEIMMGHTFTDTSYRSALKSPIGSKILSVIGTVANIVTIAAGMPSNDWEKIGETIVNRLPNL